MSDTLGRKFDGDKPQPSLMPAPALLAISLDNPNLPILGV